MFDMSTGAVSVLHCTHMFVIGSVANFLGMSQFTLCARVSVCVLCV